MKKVRIVLSALAFVVALGAAFASSHRPLVTGFRWVSGTPHCISSSQECPGGSQLCVDTNSNAIYDSDVPSGMTCGTRLTFNN